MSDFTLAETCPDEIQAIFTKYPPDQKRAAVMPLLHLAQRKAGCVTKDILREIADLCEIEPTEVASVVGFYTLYYDQPAGKYRLQVCTDLPCALRGARKFLDDLCQNLGIQVGETTPDGIITVEEVKCLAACDKAPMFQLQSLDNTSDTDALQYHENQTLESALALIEELRQRHSNPETEQPAQKDQTEPSNQSIESME